MHRVDPLPQQVTRQLQGEAGFAGSNVAAVHQQPGGLVEDGDMFVPVEEVQRLQPCRNCR